MMLSLASLAASEECAAPTPVVVIPASDAANSTRHFASLPCETAAASVLARIPENMISTNAAPGEGSPIADAPLWKISPRTDTCFRAIVDNLLSEEEAIALSQALEPALLAGLGADGTSVVPIPTAPAVGGVWARAAGGDGERARLIALALQRSKEQLKAFGVAEDSLVPTPHVVARTDRPESVGRVAPDAAERARERRAALENGRWSIAQAIGEASHSVRPHIDALYMPNTRFTVLIYLTGQLVEGGETLIVDEVAGDVVTSGVLATPRAGRAFVYSSTAENVHTSLGSLRGTRSMLQFWFEARL